MGFLNIEMIEKQNYQITPNMKFRYFLYLILFPIILPIIIFSKNIFITILAVIIFLWLARILLDLPSQHFWLDLSAMFKPITSFNAFKKLFKPNEDDIRVIPKLNLIYSITVPFYILYRLIQYSITFTLLFLIFLTFI